MEMQTEMPTQTAAVSNDLTDLNIDYGGSHEIIYYVVATSQFFTWHCPKVVTRHGQKN